MPHAANIEIVPSPIVHDQSTLHGTRQHVEALKHRTEPIVDSTEDNPLFKYDKVENTYDMILIYDFYPVYFVNSSLTALPALPGRVFEFEMTYFCIIGDKVGFGMIASVFDAI